MNFTPEMVLDKEVFDSRGGLVGAVVDVGVHDMRRVKFLVVSDGPNAESPGAVVPSSLKRLSVDLIETVGTRGVVLKVQDA